MDMFISIKTHLSRRYET